MENLPPELLSNIAAFCNYNAKLKLSSATRYLRDVLSPLAFEHIYVGWNLDHMEQLTRLADSPLKKHVRRVTINTTILPILNKTQWIKRLYRTVVPKRNGRRGSGSMDGMDRDFMLPPLLQMYGTLLSIHGKDILESGWKNFQNVAANQQIWGHDIGERLSEASQKLSKVEHLEFVDKRNVRSDEPDSSHDPLVQCSPWKNVLLDPTKHYNLMGEGWENGYNDEQMDISAVVWHHVADWSLDDLPCASGAKELTIECGHHVPVKWVFTLPNVEECEGWHGRAEDSSAFERVFKMSPNLVQVNVKVNGSPFRDRQDAYDEIVSGLSQVSQLEHLKIDCGDTECDFLRAATTSKAVWPALRRLRLSGATKKDHLLDFLGRFAESLRELELVDMHITWQSGSDEPPRWDDCLEDMRQIVHLERAYVRRLYDHGYDYPVIFFPVTPGPTSEVNKTVEGFLTGRVEVLPDQELWDEVPGCEVPDESDYGSLLEDFSDDESSPADEGASGSASGQE